MISSLGPSRIHGAMDWEPVAQGHAPGTVPSHSPLSQGCWRVLGFAREVAGLWTGHGSHGVGRQTAGAHKRAAFKEANTHANPLSFRTGGAEGPAATIWPGRGEVAPGRGGEVVSAPFPRPPLPRNGAVGWVRDQNNKKNENAIFGTIPSWGVGKRHPLPPFW